MHSCRNLCRLPYAVPGLLILELWLVENKHFPEIHVFYFFCRFCCCLDSCSQTFHCSWGLSFLSCQRRPQWVQRPPPAAITTSVSGLFHHLLLVSDQELNICTLPPSPKHCNRGLESALIRNTDFAPLGPTRHLRLIGKRIQAWHLCFYTVFLLSLTLHQNSVC